jgi:hypothetical protein
MLPAWRQSFTEAAHTTWKVERAWLRETLSPTGTSEQTEHIQLAI